MKSREERVRETYSCCAFAGEDYANEALLALQELLDDDAKKDDKGIHRDVTSETVLRGNTKVHGILRAKQTGIVAGLTEVLAFYQMHNLKAKTSKKDGDKIEKGEIIAELEGSERDFLKVERTGLNMLQRMSGIATKTRKLADVAGAYNTRIVGTRKTIFRFLDKKAVLSGGGLPHRMGLDDAVLIKDNHLEAIKAEGEEDPIGTAIERAYTARYELPPKFIEIEVSKFKDAIRAAEKYRAIRTGAEGHKDLKPETPDISLVPFVIMFDNMAPARIKRAVRELKDRGLYDYVLLEASGGITEKNLKAYAASGVDALSLGAITHSVKALDISQKIVKRVK